MKLLKVLQGIFLVLLTFALSVAALLTASAFKWVGELPSPEQLDAFEFTATSQIFARDGSQIGEILPFVGSERSTTNRIPVDLSEVSPALLQALVASEDDRFFEHYGFDIPGLVRATYAEFFGDADRGGSTITTQVVKNELLSDIASTRSLERKFKELMLAVQLERRLTKEEILQRYINVSFWGGNAWGIHAAANAYFGKDPIELSLAESLYLARLVPAPNIFRKDFLGTRSSMRRVLDNMLEQNVISQRAADAAWREQIQPRGWQVTYDEAGNVLSAEVTGETPNTQTSVSSSLSDEITVAVRNWLIQRYGVERVYNNGGFRVFTTFDVQAQEAAMNASRNAEAPEGAQLAVVGIDPATGEVLAMVGERIGLEPAEDTQDRFNRALDAKRQPGSSFKPIAYATAIEQAHFSQATILDDSETTFKQRGQPDWKPANHNKKFDGAKTIRYHLDTSRNIPAIKALEAATPDAVADRARELGYQNVQPYYSIALGTIETTPLQHAAAMGAFANGGVKMEPYFIERVEDADGNVLYEATPRSTRVWSPQTAYIVLDMMHGNVMDNVGVTGFSNRAKISGRWVAGKTGTTNDEKDIWFVGMTPGMVSAVWIGYDDPQPIPKEMPPELTRAGDGDVNSSRQPIYIWKDFVQEALRNKPSTTEGFPVPEGIVFRNIDVQTGVATPNGVRAAFLANTPLRSEPLLEELELTIPIDTRTQKRATPLTPRRFIEYRPVRANDIGTYIN